MGTNPGELAQERPLLYMVSCVAHAGITTSRPVYQSSIMIATHYVETFESEEEVDSGACKSKTKLRSDHV